MKTTIFKLNILLLFMLFSCKSTSQIIINMAGDNNNYPNDYLSNGEYYIKDINNNLDNFTGTWEYVNGNEKFQIILTKIIFYHYENSNNGLNYFEDGIKLQYKKFISI